MTLLERFLGIDYGSSRIGIAISDPLGIIAKGIGVILNNADTFKKLKEYIVMYSIRKVIVGLPLNLKGEMGQKALEVEQFIKGLVDETGVEVLRLDERFTSQTAQKTLIEMGVKKMKRREKGQVDEMAAAIILQSFLDAQKRA